MIRVLLFLLCVSYMIAEECVTCRDNLGNTTASFAHYLVAIEATAVAIHLLSVTKNLIIDYSVPYTGIGAFLLLGTTKYVLTYYKDYFPDNWANKWHFAEVDHDRHHSYKRIPFEYAPVRLKYSKSVERTGLYVTLTSFSSNSNRFFWTFSSFELAYYCYVLYLYYTSSTRFNRINVLLNYGLQAAIIAYKLFDVSDAYAISRLNRRKN